MKAGNIVLAPLPQADGQVKNRPVLLLRSMPPFGDWLVCGISTQLAQVVIGFDEVIGISKPDFARSGLRSASLIKCVTDQIRVFGSTTTSERGWRDRFNCF